MQLDKLCVACFSPTHTSMKIARAIADGTHIARREEIDLTTDPADTPIAVRNAICIVAAPVYVPMWRGLDHLINNYLDNITLADLIQPEEPWSNYVI